MTWLVVDIGGTNTRCAIAGPGIAVGHVARFRNRDHPALEPLLLNYLAGLPPDRRPDRAALAIAAVIGDDAVDMTNIGWSFSIRELGKTLDLDEILALNDFEALAYALPALQTTDLAQIGGGGSRPDAPKIVLGAGTGLGMAGLVFVAGRPVAVASEGGHVSMAAYDERETYLIEAARRRYGHPSAERLLSGPGITFIHETLHGGPARSPEDIGSALLNGEPASRESYELFFRMLGTVAANMALSFGAFGGVYVGGGIAPHYVAQIETAGFRERFEDKGRYDSYLQAIPTYVITADQPTLLGLAAFTAQR